MRCGSSSSRSSRSCTPSSATAAPSGSSGGRTAGWASPGCPTEPPLVPTRPRLPASWLPFLIFLAACTLLAVVLGTVGSFLTERRERRDDAAGDQPDPQRAWATIRTACARRVKASVKRARVEQLVFDFLSAIAEYQRATGLDPGPARRYVAEAIARELTVERRPAVRAALAHARALLDAEDADAVALSEPAREPGDG
jgi:hypothetical protein